MKKQTATTIKDKMTLREKEVTTTFNEIVDTIEKYFALAPFEWFKDDDGELGAKSFPAVPPGKFRYFTSYTEHWAGKLLPEAAEIQRTLIDRNDTSDEPGGLAYALHEFGFICGVLVGVKHQGGTREQLLNQCQAWSVTRLDWEQRRLTDEAEKQAQK